MDGLDGNVEDDEDGHNDKEQDEDGYDKEGLDDNQHTGCATPNEPAFSDISINSGISDHKFQMFI